MHHCMILLFNPYDVIAAVPVLPASSSCRHFTPLVWRAAGTSFSSGAALHHGADGRRDSLSSNESRFITGTGCYDSLQCQCQVEKTSIREAMNLLHHRRELREHVFVISKTSASPGKFRMAAWKLGRMSVKKRG